MIKQINLCQAEEMLQQLQNQNNLRRNRFLHHMIALDDDRAEFDQGRATEIHLPSAEHPL